MSKKRTLNLPKYIALIPNGKYAVKIYSKALKKIMHIGCYEFIDDAINARDEWILNNPSAGCMPRGVSPLKGRFTSSITFNGQTIYLGLFYTLEDAVQYRKEVIMGLL